MGISKLRIPPASHPFLCLVKCVSVRVLASPFVCVRACMHVFVTVYKGYISVHFQPKALESEQSEPLFFFFFFHIRESSSWQAGSWLCEAHVVSVKP